MNRLLVVCSVVVLAAANSSCGSYSSNGKMTPGSVATILLFNGTGTSPNDVAAIETIVDDRHLSYTTVNAEQLNRMNQIQLRGYHLLIIPGGNFIDIGNSLTPGTTSNIRNAVHDGLNYLGICAGGFLAGSSKYYNCLNLTGVQFGFYAAGAHKAAVSIACPGTPTLEQYWEDGPQFTGWGEVVGKYPDGTPAIVQGTFGSGCVILTGVHTEAPAAWRLRMDFNTSADTDNAYAATLILAALHCNQLPHY